MLYPLPTRSSLAVREVPGSCENYLDDLRAFICLRLDRLDPYAESEEYCRLMREAARLQDALLGMLPEAGRDLLLRYAEALGAAHCLETALAAEQAFRDGMRMAMGVKSRES